jgi:hypothetical protein
MIQRCTKSHLLTVVYSGWQLKSGIVKSSVILCGTHIPDLQVIDQSDTVITFGAGVTLSRMQEELTRAIGSKPGTPYTYMGVSLDMVKTRFMSLSRNTYLFCGVYFQFYIGHYIT